MESGVERFVVDDGWFGARRDDTAGLGDRVMVVVSEDAVERLTRVLLTLYMLRKFSIPSFFPFISGLVTKIRRDTIGISCFSQSTCTSPKKKRTGIKRLTALTTSHTL